MIKHILRTNRIFFLILLVFHSILAHGQYCTVTIAQPGYDVGLTNVTLGTINKGSGVEGNGNCDPGVTTGYYDYTISTTNLAKGNTYTMNVSVANACGGDATDVEVYIDYNGNTVFDSWELVGVVQSLSSATIGSLTFTVPCNSSLGNTRMRVAADATGWEPTIGACSRDYGETEDYTVNITASTGPSSLVTQSNTTPVSQGSANMAIIGVQVTSCSAGNVTSFTFNTTGTTNTADITNAKLWYTGTSSSFVATTQLGTTNATPNGTFTINGFIQAVSTSTEYFWLSYDVPGTATAGNVIDGQCTSVTIGGSPIAPSPTTVTGSRTISAVSTTTTQASTSNVYPGNAMNKVLGVQVTSAGSIAVTSFTFNTTGTTITADITNAKLWYTGTSNSFATTTQLGATNATPNGTFTINGFAQAVSGSTEYFWLSYDIPLTATVGNVVDGQCTSVTIGSAAHTPAIQAPAGSRLIHALLVSTLYPIIAAGNSHCLAVCNTGIVQSWGYDGIPLLGGQLGDDTFLVNQPLPVPVATITGITAVAAGMNHSLALKNDGTVWAWGSDTMGQLGDNASHGDRYTPAKVATLTGITAIAAGWWHSIALKNDGTVWTWGRDSWGQLGDNAALVDQPTPVMIPSLAGIVAISAGQSHSLALKNDGTVWSWGSDVMGQLGDNASNTDHPTPVAVANLTGIIAIAAGALTSFALKSDGTEWSWGNGASGELGNIAYAGGHTMTPVPITTLTDIIAIAGGEKHALALKIDGTAWSWGEDNNGELGDDAALVPQYTPVPVAALTGIIAISAGAWHSLALKNNGTVWSWGGDSKGELGNNFGLVDQPTPVLVGSCTVTPLPVEIISFTAIPVNNKTVLTEWTTASEINNDHFTVERSVNNANWEYVGTVAGAGYSTSTINYSLEDKTPYMGTSYYRLRQTDFNGDFEYFGPVPVNLQGIDIINLYPNPVGDKMEYIIVSSIEGSVEIEAIDVLGRKVISRNDHISIGENNMKLSFQDLASGSYMVHVYMANGNYVAQRQFAVR